MLDRLLEKLRGDFEPAVGCKSFLHAAARPHVMQHEQRADAAHQRRQKACGPAVEQEIKTATEQVVGVHRESSLLCRTADVLRPSLPDMCQSWLTRPKPRGGDIVPKRPL